MVFFSAHRSPTSSDVELEAWCGGKVHGHGNTLRVG